MLSAFLKDCCVLKPEKRTRAKDLYEHYQRWCDSEAVAQAPHKVFRLAMVSRGFAYVVASESADFWAGIGLKP